MRVQDQIRNVPAVSTGNTEAGCFQERFMRVELSSSEIAGSPSIAGENQVLKKIMHPYVDNDLQLKPHHMNEIEVWTGKSGSVKMYWENEGAGLL